MIAVKGFFDLNTAAFSPCRRYRYSLWRSWDSSKPTCAFIGLNPSTADESVDDPTVRRCKRFARDWGFGALVMLNLFGFRATNPDDMMSESEPVGADNDETILQVARESRRIVAAWGTLGHWRNRDRHVCGLLKDFPIVCLARTKWGFPQHPLYVRADVVPAPYTI